MSPPPCYSVHDVNATLQCSFVKNNADCQNVEGLLNYINFVYCDFEYRPIPILICALWLIILFVTLGTTTDDYFCPCLEVISKVLKLSHNVAGVTFLAFGNGAPDIFSSIAGTKQMRPELVFGALIGAGIFVTCIVVGSIILTTPFTMVQRPFLRDVIFYLVAVFCTFCYFYKKTITLYDSISFIVLYVVYIIVVLVSHYVYQKYLKPHNTIRNGLAAVPTIIVTPVTCTGAVNDLMDIEHNPDDEIVPWGAPPIARRWSAEESMIDTSGLPSFTHSHEQRLLVSTEVTPLISSPSPIAPLASTESTLCTFFRHLSPFDSSIWQKSHWCLKLLMILKSPVVVMLNLTIPVVNYDKELNYWNRLMAILHCISSPVFFIFAVGYGHYCIGKILPLWSLGLIGGSLVGVIIWCTSSNRHPPFYHSAFAFLGFATAVTWIYLVANEIVTILKTIGLVLHLSDAILGLTVLAWGNSLSDLIADVAIAKQGFPRMGISACFGGPLFNLLLGIGIPFTLATLKQENYSVQVPYQSAMTILASFLFASLLSALIIVPIMKFRLNKLYGAYLIALYILFLILSIMNELKLF